MSAMRLAFRQAQDPCSFCLLAPVSLLIQLTPQQGVLTSAGGRWWWWWWCVCLSVTHSTSIPLWGLSPTVLNQKTVPSQGTKATSHLNLPPNPNPLPSARKAYWGHSSLHCSLLLFPGLPGPPFPFLSPLFPAGQDPPSLNLRQKPEDLLTEKV